MNYDVKYIYFELYSEPVIGEKKAEPSIQNENALMFKPHTNSSGIWGFTNITKSYRYKTKVSSTVVNQYWIDLVIYDPYTHDGGKFDIIVNKVLNKLNIKLRKPKLEQIKSNI